MTEILRRTLGERIEIREVLAPTLVRTMIDRGQLGNVLLNLTVNARDAMPEGGVLTIITENSRVAADQTEGGNGVRPGDYAVISVTDSGTGMPAEVLDRIFEPFFTTKGFGKGSGLGLSMVYGFVSQSGGHITVDSKVGRGTTVKLYLPGAESAEVQKEAPVKDGQDKGGEDVVMVVEGDDRLRNAAVKALRKQGYQVVEAGSGPAAVVRLHDVQKLDLLFTDLSLPDGMSGAQLAEEVCRQRPQTRLLFTSDKADKGRPSEGLAGRKVEVLAKPYRVYALVRKVRDVLSQPPLA